jgi:hypothetical protein
MSLDDDLTAWAAAVRLTDADAEAIFQRIVLQGTVAPTATATATPTAAAAAAPSAAAAAPSAARKAAKAARMAAPPRAVTAFPVAAASAAVLSAPAGLPPSWWRDYTKGFANRMVTATRPVLAAA